MSAITCLFNGSEIEIQEALAIRNIEDSPLFLCVCCGERVRPLSEGGDQIAHFRHEVRNPECPLSDSDSYQPRGIDGRVLQSPDAADAIEGYKKERTYLTYRRNAAVVVECKERDNYSCRACGFAMRVNGRSIVECHHLVQLAHGGERVTSIDDLVSLCPNCHRVAHTSIPPLPLEEIAKLVKSRIKARAKK
jgi:hypothetical protein